MTDNDLIEWLETAIDDSFDLGWTSLDAAKLIVSRMRDEGLVMVIPKPRGTDCPQSYDGHHHVDTSMEEGPYNCFHCGRSMKP